MNKYHNAHTNRNRKPPTDFALKGTLSRINRAITLIKSGSVVPYSNGQWLVESSKLNSPYRVTIEGCQCADFLLNKTVCKHRWAVIASVSVIIFERVLAAPSVESLEHVKAEYESEIDSLPSEFRSVIEASYNKRLSELEPHIPPTSREIRRFISTRASRLGEGAMLIKPQPKSNGRINGIEI